MTTPHHTHLPTPTITTINVNNMNFLATAMTDTSATARAPAKIRGKKSKIKEVVYPIFAYYATLYDDVFWVDIYTQASYGKIPKKFSFSEMTLHYSKGAKQESLPLYQTPEAAEAASQFFRTHGAIYSPTDQRLALDQHQMNQAQVKPLTWSSANRKTRISLVSNYVTEIAKTMKLTESERAQLAETIHLGIGAKLLNLNNIEVAINKIVKIDGLYWNEQLRSFYIDANLKPVRASTRASDKSKAVVVVKRDKATPMFRSHWRKFLDEQLHTRQLTADQRRAFNMNVMVNSSQSYHSDDGSLLSDSDSEC